jgi:GMP synthase-like glutamine amidotransferase
MPPAPRVLVVQQVANEPAGTLGDALAAAGATVRVLRPFDGEPVPPSADALDGLVLLGGPMAVYEQGAYPFLTAELRLLASALAAGVPVLGVCLGSQLLAHALGAEVRPSGTVEMGWLPVTFEPAAVDDPVVGPLARGGEPFVPFHQHGDVFDLPAGATALARSARTRLQAFVARGAGGAPAYGLLFHAEVDAPLVATMVAEFGGGARAAGADPGRMRDEAPARLAALAPRAAATFARWAALLGARA